MKARSQNVALRHPPQEPDFIALHFALYRSWRLSREKESLIRLHFEMSTLQSHYNGLLTQPHIVKRLAEFVRNVLILRVVLAIKDMLYMRDVFEVLMYNNI